MPDTCQSLMKLPYRPANPEWGRFTPHGVNTFVFISAHRISPLDFAVIGLSARSMRSQWRSVRSNGGDSSAAGEDLSGGCMWVSYDGPHTIKGSLDYLFPGDHGNMPYETIVIRCNLDKPTPADPGGALFYHISGRDMLVHREDDLRPPASTAAAAATATGGSGQREGEGGEERAPAAKRILNPPRPLPHQISFCSLLIDQEFTPARVLEHMQYLLFFGADDFIFYDGGGFSDGLRDAVSRFTDAGMLQVMDLRGLADLPAHHNVITMNDCAYRTRFTSEWVISLAFDELPHVVGPFRLSTLLAFHAGRPWLSMGSYSWHIELCLPITAPNHWLQQRMVFRSVHPTCHASSGTSTTTTPTFITAPPAAAALVPPASNATSNTTSRKLADAAAAGGAAANASGAATEGPSEPMFTGDPNMCLGEAGRRRVMFDPRQIHAMAEHYCAIPFRGGVDLNASIMHTNKYTGLLEPAALICEYHLMKGTEPRSYKRKMHVAKLIRQGRQAGLIALPVKE
ncbi:hypothetical protein CLOM_g2894 [Closterium sp. NIES-68]|nr:hypothetical protein CLOM_g2894 [Closterium sp. NIES-68]GJP79093.1 hypothetical protein CLOP_g9336 [Closterium sp. NIES-67]